MTNSMEAHVTAMTCETFGDDEPRFGKFLTNHFDVAQSVRMACRPRNFTKAGFFFCACRTPHDSKRQCPGLRGTKQGALYEGRRSRSVCEEPTRTSKWFDKGLAHHTGARKMNRIATRNVVLRDGVKAGSNLLALPIA